MALRYPNYERDSQDQNEPSEDALLGAIMESEWQSAIIKLTKGFYDLFRK